MLDRVVHHCKRKGASAECKPKGQRNVFLPLCRILRLIIKNTITSPPAQPDKCQVLLKSGGWVAVQREGVLVTFRTFFRPKLASIDGDRSSGTALSRLSSFSDAKDADFCPSKLRKHTYTGPAAVSHFGQIFDRSIRLTHTHAERRCVLCNIFRGAPRRTYFCKIERACRSRFAWPQPAQFFRTATPLVWMLLHATGKRCEKVCLFVVGLGLHFS